MEKYTNAQEKEKLDQFLEEFRAPFMADGGDMVVEKLEEGRLFLRIIIGPDGCAECIMPPEVIRNILGTNIKRGLNKDYEINIVVEDRTKNQGGKNV